MGMNVSEVSRVGSASAEMATNTTIVTLVATNQLSVLMFSSMEMDCPLCGPDYQERDRVVVDLWRMRSNPISSYFRVAGHPTSAARTCYLLRGSVPLCE